MTDDSRRIHRTPPAEYQAWRDGFRAGRGVHRGTLVAALIAALLLLLAWLSCAA